MTPVNVKNFFRGLTLKIRVNTRSKGKRVPAGILDCVT